MKTNLSWHPQRHAFQTQVVTTPKSYSMLMFKDIQKLLLQDFTQNHIKFSHKIIKSFFEP
jgi:hypothetical protein